jgi:hypothetical protein
MKFKFSLALLLSAIVLASCGSATQISTSLVSGVTSAVQNGGTSGITLNTANYYQDAGGAQAFPSLAINGLGLTYENVLSEYVGVTAHVNDGIIGSASASFDTQTPQAFTFTNPIGPCKTSTTLNGALAVTLTKTSIDGSADANAVMIAQSGATFVGANLPKVGASALLFASESLQGTGSALAQVSKATATANSLVGGITPANYATVSAAGDIKLTAKNANDDLTLATNGGQATGTAYISSDAQEAATGVGESQTNEFMTLNALRGQSFSGTSYADGYLNGQEMGEATWQNPANGKSTVDLESTSQITQSVAAHNIRDTATTTAWLIPDAQTRSTGTAVASNNWYDFASVTRDQPVSASSPSSTLKAEANAYVPIATWTASGSVAGPGSFAAVSGTQGLSWDGAPAINKGFGVGAWILNAYNQPQVAHVQALETADTANTGTATANYDLYLNGMKTITGTQNDAVGAFGGVANQVVSIKRILPFTGTITSYSPKIKDVNAINWLVGDDANPLPGAGKYSPMDLVISFTPTDALQRTTELTYAQTK